MPRTRLSTARNTAFSSSGAAGNVALRAGYASPHARDAYFRFVIRLRAYLASASRRGEDRYAWYAGSRQLFQAMDCGSIAVSTAVLR